MIGKLSDGPVMQSNKKTKAAFEKMYAEQKMNEMRLKKL